MEHDDKVPRKTVVLTEINILKTNTHKQHASIYAWIQNLTSHQFHRFYMRRYHAGWQPYSYL